MCAIGGVVSVLEKRGADFTVESLAKEIRQDWIEEALSQTGRESVREHLLPAPVTVWLVILMGLHRRTSYVTVIDEMKTHLCDCATVNRPVVFRSKTPDRVVQELWGMLTAYNAVRKTMCEAARQKELDPRRVSFTSALERIREATYEMMRLPTTRLAQGTSRCPPPSRGCSSPSAPAGASRER